MAGTPQYMSPEQAQGKPVDARSDLFSLGSVVYAMCTGRSPFRAETTVASLRRVCEDTPRPIRQINPDIPEWLVAIVDRLLEKNPDDRFQTATEVADVLSRQLAHLQNPQLQPFPEAVTPAKPKSARPANPRRRWAVAAAILLAVFGLATISDATGVTHIAATVIRIATGEGTLAIEVDDPSVHVSIDGEDVSISGAGIQELKLHPGQYSLRATRDGEPVKQELVTITRGARRVVRVIRESVVPRPALPWDQILPAGSPPPAIAPFNAAKAKEYQAAWAKHLGVNVTMENSIGMKFVLIPPGEFDMGSTEEEVARAVEQAKTTNQPSWQIKRLRTEAPKHRVRITKPFWLGAHEVTRGQFRRFVDEGGYKTTAERDGKGGCVRRLGPGVSGPLLGRRRPVLPGGRPRQGRAVVPELLPGLPPREDSFLIRVAVARMGSRGSGAWSGA